ncbi:glycosyltransferase [Gordonia sputi]|uniref:glycosyltransferase n=1 Tax=Gordonia sputi TaxID=36823 RepID=UPI0022703E79|nr:glycosyltransferase [Gordonia sputi]
MRRIDHPITPSVELPEPSARPRAVGLFGIVYRGKGFERIARIREVLPDDIEIRIAGRGTESIPSSPGVTVLGTLDEDELAGFFGSIQALLMPYGRRSPYGIAYPASGVAARSISHQTPYIATDHGALGELGAEGGAIVVPGESEDLAGLMARQAAQLLDDPAQLGTLHDQLVRMCKERTPKQIAELLVDTWSR